MDDTGQFTSPAPRPVRPKKQDRTTMVLLFAASLVAVGGIGFAAGHLTAPAAAANATFARSAAGFSRTGSGGFPSFAPGASFNLGELGNGFGGAGIRGLGGLNGDVSGTVESIDGSTMTIKTASGETVTIDLTGSTTYHSEASASADQVQVGSSVTVQIDTSALASATPVPGASGAGQRISASDVLITK